MTTANLAAEITSNIEAATYDVTAQDAVITITSHRTGQHRTFKIRTCRRGVFKGKRVVSLLTGPNNNEAGDWTGFAFASEFGVHVWSRLRGWSALPSNYDIFAKMIENPSRYIAKGSTYQVSTTCTKCGRVLTDPASIEANMGPECRKKNV